MSQWEYYGRIDGPHNYNQGLAVFQLPGARVSIISPSISVRQSPSSTSLPSSTLAPTLTSTLAPTLTRWGRWKMRTVRIMSIKRQSPSSTSLVSSPLPLTQLGQDFFQTLESFKRVFLWLTKVFQLWICISWKEDFYSAAACAPPACYRLPGRFERKPSEDNRRRKPTETTNSVTGARLVGGYYWML